MYWIELKGQKCPLGPVGVKSMAWKSILVEIEECAYTKTTFSKDL